MQKIVIVGIGGGHGQILAHRLQKKFKIEGIERKSWNGQGPDNVEVLATDIRHNDCEKIFSNKDINAVIYLLGAKAYQSSKRHYNNNVREFKALLEYVTKYQVKKFVFLSSHEVYGAIPARARFLEEDALLEGKSSYSEMRKSVEMDKIASDLFWKAPKTETVILRPVNVLGPKTDGLLNTYLRQKIVPSVFGFNPMMSIVHEEDVSKAIEMSLKSGIKGVFNITGPGSLPLAFLIENANISRIPLLEPLSRLLVKAANQFNGFPHSL